MTTFDLNAVAVLTGFISGFLLSVPVGPVNLTIINEGARRGLWWAMLIGFGATAMEVIYCALAFTGFSSFFHGKTIKAIMEIASFGFFLYLGIHFLRVHKIERKEPSAGKFIKLNPHSAFAVGFVRVMANPGVFLFWIVLAAAFKARDWVPSNFAGASSCVAGVALGTSLFFCSLSYAASRGHGKFTDKTLLRIEHVSGIIMVVVAAGQGVNIFWQWHKHRL